MDVKHVLSMNPAVGPAYVDQVHVPAADPVPSNWIDCISDGGYQRPKLWKSDGWCRTQSEGWMAPEY